MSLKLDESLVDPLTSSELSLSQHILPAGQVVSQRFYAWVGVPVPSLNALLDYRCPVHVSYSSLLKVLARAT